MRTKPLATAPREAFVLNRQLEFFSEAELEKQLGHPFPWWQAVLVGELVDNALDHCEEAGILPSITVVLRDDSITVSDNGSGIPPGVVSSMLNFETRTSSRIGHATPTRGQQGNAAKCLLAVPYVMNRKVGRVEIDAAGVCHRIDVALDAIARMPVISHAKGDGKVQNGTSITAYLPCPEAAPRTQRIVSLLREYAAINPHAEFSLDYFGEQVCWKRTTDAIGKWTAAAPDPSHWHDEQSFENLIAACVHQDRTRGTSRTVREFARQFAGLKRSDAISRVLDSTGLSRCELASLVGQHGVDSKQASKLLSAMNAHTDPPKPLKLGSIGRSHIESAFGGDVQYKRICGTTAAGLPFVVEAAFAERDEGDRELFTGVNFSVDIRSPAFEHTDALLERFKVTDDTPTTVLLHLTTPRVRYTNRGKTEIDICAKLEDAIEQAVQAVTKRFTAKAKAAERDASRIERDAMRRTAGCSLKDAIFAVMEESIGVVSQGGACDFSARSHYYAVRPLVQQYTSKPLSQGYLDAVIDEWESIHGIIERRTRDPRGFLLEPHTGKQIPLGTRQVDGYQIPLHLYHTIIYVEKKGLLPNFQFGRIAEKYDAAIICAEGYAVRAAQSLMQTAANGHSMKVFVFHDADPAGYSIAKKIGENSGAHKFNFEIIDAGLRLDEALDMGLPTEMFTRPRRLDKSIHLTARERRLFEGERRTITGRNGRERPQWINCQRVELNALAANPTMFVEWVESKLIEHGAAKKLVPNDSAILAAVESTYARERESQVRSALLAALDVPAAVSAICNEMPSPDFHQAIHKVRRWAKGLKPTRWTSVCDSIALSSLDAQREQIEKAVEMKVRGNGGRL